MAELLINCKACGKQVSSKAKTCPHCGRRLKMALWLKIIIGILVVTIAPQAISGFLSGFKRSTSEMDTVVGAVKKSTEILGETITPTGSVNQTAVDIRPEEQRQLEAVIATFSQQFDKAQNELQESTYRRDRMNAIKDLNIKLQINGWIGTLNQLKTNTEGKAYITIKLNNNVTIGTWNNGLSDIGANTLIPMDSDLFKTLSNMKTGQKVRFSGSFIKSDIDYFKEKSLTIRGAMKNPDFLMLFSNVEAIN
jgi:RNA polymerase subunit RPABC4/transcription elongation factor Spt4